MVFEFRSEAIERLKKPLPLTRDEIEELFPYVGDLQEPHVRLLWIHLTILTMKALDENRGAIERFNSSSASLTRMLLALTVVITVFTVLLWFKG